MAMADVVGSMGLTLFCNKCVEIFYRFQQDQPVDGDEFKSTCNMARSAFVSFKSPGSYTVQPADRHSLFNTNEEVMSFARVVKGQSEKTEKVIEELIANIESVCNDKTGSIERKKAAERLQKFFDQLGDYSFDATSAPLLFD